MGEGYFSSLLGYCRAHQLQVKDVVNLTGLGETGPTPGDAEKIGATGVMIVNQQRGEMET